MQRSKISRFKSIFQYSWPWQIFHHWYPLPARLSIYRYLTILLRNTDEKKSWSTDWETHLTSFNTTNYRINTVDTKWTGICWNVLVKRNQLTETQLYTKATLDFPEDRTRFPTPLLSLIHLSNLSPSCKMIEDY